MSDVRTDAQTGLPSRAAFFEDLHRRLAQSHRFDTRLSLMLLKLDRLPEVVEDYDVNSALIMRSYSLFVRSDVRDMDLVARYDFDTFGLMLPNTELVYAAGVADRIRRNLAQNPIQLPSGPVLMTASVGVAEVQKGDDEMSLLDRAAAALHAAVCEGGNCIRFHTGISIESLPSQIEMAGEAI